MIIAPSPISSTIIVLSTTLSSLSSDRLEVIVADEIGNKDEIDPIMQAICSGIKGIFTAHGATIEDIKLNPTIKELADNGVFERIIFLSDKKEKGEVEKVYALNKMEKQYILYNKC